jgi:hypothetical protein
MHNQFEKDQTLEQNTTSICIYSLYADNYHDMIMNAAFFFLHNVIEGVDRESCFFSILMFDNECNKSSKKMNYSCESHVFRWNIKADDEYAKHM